MIEFVKCWMSLRTDRRGVTALEYGLIAGVVALALVGGFGAVGTGLTAKFNAIAGNLGVAAPASGS